MSTTDWRRNPPADVATRVFDPAVIERDVPGKKVEVPGYEGWAWPELDQIRPTGGTTRAQLDAFKLLAVFIQHSDTKPDQQRRGEEITGADGRKRKVTVDDWVRVFKRKRSEIAAARCQ